MPVINIPRTRLEPISARSRRMRSGMIGLRTRDSSTRKPASSASEAPAAPSVRGVELRLYYETASISEFLLGSTNMIESMAKAVEAPNARTGHPGSHPARLTME